MKKLQYLLISSFVTVFTVLVSVGLVLDNVATAKIQTTNPVAVVAAAEV